MSTADKSYLIEGGRVGVLLIHGLCGTPSEMRFVANGLARAGLTVHCPQLAGHGGSHVNLQSTTWQDWYKSAEAGLAELMERCDTVIAGGLSTGAVLSLLLAANHPEKVHAVALYSPTLWLSGRSVPWYARLFKLVRFKAIADLVNFPIPGHVGIKDRRIREFILNSVGSGVSALSTPGGTALERLRLANFAMRQVGRVNQPALIIHSREDDYAGLDNVAYLQRHLAGPVDLAVLNDSYHMVTVDRQRDVVVERTRDFAGRISAALADAPEQGKRLPLARPA